MELYGNVDYLRIRVWPRWNTKLVKNCTVLRTVSMKFPVDKTEILQVEHAALKKINLNKNNVQGGRATLKIELE